jgi:hypothetical protein
MQPVMHVLLQATRDLSLQSENASKSFSQVVQPIFHKE